MSGIAPFTSSDQTSLTTTETSSDNTSATSFYYHRRDGQVRNGIIEIYYYIELINSNFMKIYM